MNGSKGIVYLSGPISGNPERYRDEFRLARDRVWAAGYTPVSTDFLPLGLRESDYMRISLAVLEAADTVVTLSGWSSSEGTLIEVAYAKRIGKPVETLLRFCERNDLPAITGEKEMDRREQT